MVGFFAYIIVRLFFESFDSTYWLLLLCSAHGSQATLLPHLLFVALGATLKFQFIELFN